MRQQSVDRTASNPGPSPSDGTFHLLDEHGINALPRTDVLSPGLAALVKREVHRDETEPTPPRLTALLNCLGFSWEPLSEPGHMRVLGPAAILLDQTLRYARYTMEDALAGLGIPALPVDGVELVDSASARLRDYLDLILGDPGLYGAAPYLVRSADGEYLLRQTSCLQKYSFCADRPIDPDALPAALIEVSNSFRYEPEQRLRLCYRMRRFHLPEAHIHTRTLGEAVETARSLHRLILAELAAFEGRVVLLVSATARFAARQPEVLRGLAADLPEPALLRIAPPETICQDGVELDVEYKLIDSSGCCRELSSFQIDRRITEAFGVRCTDGSTPHTIHAVLTGSVERQIYASLDRVVRLEAQGRRGHLPLRLSPTAVRVVAPGAAANGAAERAARRLSTAGVRTEIDDRHIGKSAAVAEADANLIPHLLFIDESEDRTPTVRDYVTRAERPCGTEALLGRLLGAIGPAAGPSLPSPVRVPRLARGLFGRPSEALTEQETASCRPHLR